MLTRTSQRLPLASSWMDGLTQDFPKEDLGFGLLMTQQDASPVRAQAA